MLIGPLGASVVGLLLQQAAGHVAMRFLHLFSSFLMQLSLSHHSILLSRHRTRETLRDDREFTADTDRVSQVYFDVSPEQFTNF